MSGIASWARVGAKVLCVDAGVDTRNRYIGGIPAKITLTTGTVYTIRAVGINDHTKNTGLYLTEVVRPVYPLDVREQPFGIWRFRPLVTLEDDITTYFADLLNVREPVGVN